MNNNTSPMSQTLFTNVMNIVQTQTNPQTEKPKMTEFQTKIHSIIKNNFKEWNETLSKHKSSLRDSDLAFGIALLMISATPLIALISIHAIPIIIGSTIVSLAVIAGTLRYDKVARPRLEEAAEYSELWNLAKNNEDLNEYISLHITPSGDDKAMEKQIIAMSREHMKTNTR